MPDETTPKGDTAVVSESQAAGTEAEAKAKAAEAATDDAGPTSLLGEEPEAGAEDKPTDTGKAKEADKAETPEADPYAKLAKPTTFPVTDQDWESFKGVAKELKLTPEAAAKLVTWQEALSTQQAAAMAAETQKMLVNRQAALKAQPAFKEDFGYAKAALRQYGQEAFSRLVGGPLGDDPAVFAFLAWVGRQLGEDRPVGGTQGGKTVRDPAKLLYPSMSE